MNGLLLQSFEGQRDGSKIYHGGDGLFYHLTNDRPSRAFAYLRCVKHDRCKRPCWGTAKALLEHNILFHLKPHRHGPNHWFPGVVALRKAVTKRVKAGDQAAFAEIIQEEGQGYHLEVRAQLPPARIESRLNKIRGDLRPPVPQSLDVLGANLLEPQYRHLTQCLDMPESLFAGVCGNVADGTLSLVFICPRMQRFMESRCLVFADGTWRKLFKKPKASQIYSLCAIWRFSVIPMLRAIMIRKTQVAYTALFNFIKDLMPHFIPQKIMCDFEEAQCNAWRLAFPNANVEGCLFHFDKAVLEKARTLGLHNLIQDEEQVASIVRSALALPLLPQDQIEDSLEDLGWEAREAGWMGYLKEFFEYLNDEWMPKVPILSVYKCVHRTNNASETANKALNKAIKVSRPSYATVLRAFVLLNDRALVNIRSMDLGLSVSRGRKVSALANDRRIKNLTMDLELGDITRLQFLHRSSRRMQGLFDNVF